MTEASTSLSVPFERLYKMNGIIPGTFDLIRQAFNNADWTVAEMSQMGLVATREELEKFSQECMKYADCLRGLSDHFELVSAKSKECAASEAIKICPLPCVDENPVTPIAAPEPFTTAVKDAEGVRAAVDIMEAKQTQMPVSPRNRPKDEAHLLKTLEASSNLGNENNVSPQSLSLHQRNTTDPSNAADLLKSQSAPTASLNAFDLLKSSSPVSPRFNTLNPDHGSEVPATEYAPPSTRSTSAPIDTVGVQSSSAAEIISPPIQLEPPVAVSVTPTPSDIISVPVSSVPPPAPSVTMLPNDITSPNPIWSASTALAPLYIPQPTLSVIKDLPSHAVLRAKIAEQPLPPAIPHPSPPLNHISSVIGSSSSASPHSNTSGAVGSAPAQSNQIHGIPTFISEIPLPQPSNVPAFNLPPVSVRTTSVSSNLPTNPPTWPATSNPFVQPVAESVLHPKPLAASSGGSTDTVKPNSPPIGRSMEPASSGRSIPTPAANKGNGSMTSARTEERLTKGSSPPHQHTDNSINGGEKKMTPKEQKEKNEKKNKNKGKKPDDMAPGSSYPIINPNARLDSPDDIAVNPNEITVITYNVLADCWVSQSRYSYTSPLNSQWFYRRKKLVDMIRIHRPSVINLQEVELHFFNELVNFELKEYMGFYGQSRNKKDGVAIFYSKETFRHKDVKTVYLDKFVGPSSSKVGLAVYLESIEDASFSFMALNIHLTGDPTMPIVPMDEANHFLNEIGRCYADVPLIMCGDLNSDPDSNVCSIIQQLPLPPGFTQRQPYALKSAYCEVHGREPEVTFLTDKISRCVDYIFFRRDCFAVTYAFPLPTLRECQSNGFLPNDSQPSDHLMLAAKFVPITRNVPFANGVSPGSPSLSQFPPLGSPAYQPYVSQGPYLPLGNNYQNVNGSGSGHMSMYPPTGGH